MKDTDKPQPDYVLINVAGAVEQLELAVTAFDVREQQRRGVDHHVMTATDADIRARIQNAINLLTGGKS